jgi:hypothetical protein
MDTLQTTKADFNKDNSHELTLFWAAAILLQYLSQLDWITRLIREPSAAATIAQTTTVLLAALVILRPRQVGLFLCMAAAQITAGWLNLPTIPNHRLFTTLVDLTLVLAGASLAISRQPINITNLWSLARPLIQRLLIALYLFAAFAKLNSTYLLSPQSCGVQLYYEIGDHFPLLQSPPLALLSAWVGIAAETLLPLVLLFSMQHRNKAILVGLFFHFAIALNTARHFSDFSAVSFAALMTFATSTILTPRRSTLLGGLLVFGAVLSVATGTAAAFDSTQVHWFLLTRDLLWLCYSATVIISFIRARLLLAPSSPPAFPPAIRPLMRPILAIPLVLAVLNGLTPYLGLKTRSSWDMYSNLQLAGAHRNHLIIPQSLDLLDELGSPITIIESTNSELQQRYIQLGYDITPFELRRIFASDPSGVTTFRWRTQRFEHYPHGTGELSLSKPPDWLLSKLLWFRQVDQSSEPRCQW